MKQSTRDKLYTIDRTIRPALNITSCIWLALLVLIALDLPIKQILTYIWYGVSIVWVAFIVGRICLSPFVKSDEEEEFEQKVDYILQKRAAQQPQMPYTPLCNVSSLQEARIKQLLHDLPGHHNKPGQINLAVMAQYLTALERLGKADLKDKHNLRLWVAQVTQKEVPNASQFNEAIPSTTRTKISAAYEDLKTIL